MAAPRLNLENAIRIYYECAELSNADIAEMFDGNISTARINRMKKIAREVAIREGKPVFNKTKVNTDSAFVAWNLDIDDMIYRYQKLMKLKMKGPGSQLRGGDKTTTGQAEGREK